MRLRDQVNPDTKLHAKEHRSHPTPAEARLWEEIRCKKLGIRFRRQSVIRGFIADFYAPSVKLIVEVDGPSHNDQFERDNWRDYCLLRDTGIQTIRFSNRDVFLNIDIVLARIKQTIRGEGKRYERLHEVI